MSVHNRAQQQIIFGGHWDVLATTSPTIFWYLPTGVWQNLNANGNVVAPGDLWDGYASTWRDQPRFFPATSDGSLVRNGYKNSNFRVPSGLQIVTDQAPPNGKMALRCEVRSGDAPPGGSGERVELSDETDVYGFPNFLGEEDGVQFKYYAIKPDVGWQSPEADGGFIWGILSQVHSPNYLNSSPCFAFSLTNEFSIDMLGGDLQPIGQDRRDTTKYPFSDSAVREGEWSEFVFEFKWTYADDGYVKVYRRNTGETDYALVLTYNGPTLQYSSTEPEVPSDGWETKKHYWRTGFYRSSSSFTSVVYHGSVITGTTFNAVKDGAPSFSGI